MHLPKATGVPKFGREVAPFLDLLFIEADVLAAWGNAHETKTQTIRAILLDQLERVGRVTKRFGHFATVLVADQPSEINIVKWDVVFGAVGFSRLKFEASDNHSSNPKENNVRCGHKYAGRIKFLPCFLIHGFVSPKPRRKPCVERVGILRPVFGIWRRLNADINFGFFFPMPRRYPVPPPDLAANAPVSNVLQPLRVNSFPMCREEADKMVTHHGQSFLRFRVAKEPLFADPRLDRHVASLAESDIVFVCLRFRK